MRAVSVALGKSQFGLSLTENWRRSVGKIILSRNFVTK